jgi:hypothetical protein
MNPSTRHDLPRPETAVRPTRESHYELHDLVSRKLSLPPPPKGKHGDVSALVLAYTAAEQRRLIAGIVSIGLGVLIFAVPRLLNYIVAAYFVVVGVLLILEATD